MDNKKKLWKRLLAFTLAVFLSLTNLPIGNLSMVVAIADEGGGGSGSDSGQNPGDGSNQNGSSQNGGDNQGSGESQPNANPDSPEQTFENPTITSHIFVVPENDITYSISLKDNSNYTGEIIVKIGDKTLEKDTDYSVSIDGEITILKDKLSANDVISIELTETESNQTYTVSVDSDNKTMILAKNKDFTLLENEKDKNIVVSFVDTTETSFSKTWNDGRRDHEDIKEDFLKNHVVLCYRKNDDSAWISPAQDELGFELASSSIKPEYNGSVWNYTISNLPKTDAEGNELEYSFKEISGCSVDGCKVDSILSNYIQTTDPNHIINTEKINSFVDTDYKATIIWKDKDQVNEDGTHPTRPTESDYVDSEKITLYRYTSQNADPVAVVFDKKQITANEIMDGEKHTNNWTISINDLPKYDENGNEYIYYIDQNASAFTGAEEGQQIYYYDPQYVNTGAYGTKLEGLYNGGTLTNTRKEQETFTFDVEWIDGERTDFRDCELYLYRYADGDSTDVETASPVQGFDKMYFKDGVLYDENGKKIDPNADGSYTFTGADGSTEIDKYSPSGAKYTYFIKQKKLGNADYTDTYYDADGNNKPSDSEAAYSYALNGGKIVNQLKTDVTPSITKKWEAKAVQGIIDKLSVTMKLQMRYVYETSSSGTPKYSEWVDVTGEKATVTEGGFSSSEMIKDVAFDSMPKYTETDIDGLSVKADKAETSETVKLPAGSKIEYQCLETAVNYENGSNKNTYSFDDNRTTMTGIMSDNTDIVVVQEYGEDGDGAYIVNKLIDRTQVNVKKNWAGSYEWPSDDATVEVSLHREDGKTAVDLEGNSVSNITLTKADAENGKAFENLPRYDDNGREITYYVVEETKTINADDKTYKYYDTNYNKSTITIKDDDGKELNIRQTNAEIINVLPGKDGINININKRWFDDGDLTHRQTTTMGIFRKEDIESGTAFNEDGSLDRLKAVKTTDLNDGMAWTSKFEFASEAWYWTDARKQKKTVTVTDYPVYGEDGVTQLKTTKNDYIALEISVGGSAVTYEKDTNGSYSWIKDEGTRISVTSSDGPSIDKKIGQVTTADHYYNVYVGYTTANGMDGYVIYNQRRGEETIELTKTWNNGSIPKDEQPKTAYFKLYQWLEGTKTEVTETYGENLTDLTANGVSGKVIAVDNKDSVMTDADGVMNVTLSELPKYDSLGRFLSYTIEEVAVRDAADKICLVQNGTVKVSVKKDNKFILETDSTKIPHYDQYACSSSVSVTTTGSHNSDEVYSWVSSNTRQQTFEVTLRKVWRDDGTNQNTVEVRRPDIYFRMYRIPVGTEALGQTINSENDLLGLSGEQVQSILSQSGIEQVGGDYTWNTEHNNWYWTCETDGQFDRYDGLGREYLYFALEYSNNFNDYEATYYNGNTLPADRSEVKNTTEVLAGNEFEGNLLIVHKEGDGLQANGSIVNVKKGTFDATSNKIWNQLPDNFDRNTLPNITMELYRKLATEDPDETDVNLEDGKWEKIQSVDHSGNTTSFDFKDIARYDEYGRKYIFYVQERYYVLDDNGTYKKDETKGYEVIPSGDTVDNKYVLKDRIPGYTSQQQVNGDAFSWVNTYDTTAATEQRVEIVVNKTWEYPNYATGLPTQTFELWRRAEGVKDEKVSTDTATVTLDSSGSVTTNVLFTKTKDNKSGELLPYYAPNGEIYTYYVKEIVPGGYLATVSGGKDKNGTVVGTEGVQGDGNKDTVLQSEDLILEKVKTENTRDVYSNVTTTSSTDPLTVYKNVYNGKPGKEISATKTWDDLSNAYNSRPVDIRFELHQSAAGATDRTVANSEDNGTWVTDNKNLWSVQFKNPSYTDDGYTDEKLFDTYGPDGTEYKYYVNETDVTNASDPQKQALDSYVQTKTDDLNLVNTLPLTDITAVKVWQGTDGEKTWTYSGNSANDKDGHNDTELEQLFNYGAMPTKITFTLQYRDSESTEWKNLEKDGNSISRAFTITSIDDVKNVRDKGALFEDLPLYITGKNSATNYREYRVEETAEYADGSTSGIFTYDEDQTVSASNNGTTSVTNQLKMQKQTLTKVWDDETNLMNTRPNEVVFVVTNANGSQSYTMKKSATDGLNSWTQEIWLPVVTEGAGNDFTVSEPIDKQSETVKAILEKYYNKNNANHEGTVSGTTITNTKNSDIQIRTQITVSKTWNDGDYSDMYSLIRPDSITYTLQYKYANKDWKNADASCNVAENGETITVYPTTDTDGKKTWPYAVWEDLFQYFNDPDSDVAEPITYRVVETAVNGYTSGYSEDILANASNLKAENSDNTAGTITVTNTIDDSVSVSLQKNWTGSIENNQMLATALSQKADGKKENKTETETIDTVADVEALQKLGILPQAVKFKLQYYDNTEKKWIYLQKEVELKTAEDILEVLEGKVEFAKLPKYKKDGTTFEYRIVETGVKFNGEETYRNTDGDIIYSPSTPVTTTITANSVTDYQSAITNTIPTGKITVSKTAIDELNRDGKRGDIVVTLKRKQSDGNYADYATGTLSYDSVSKTWSTCDFYVPIFDSNKKNGTGFAENEWQIVETSVKGDTGNNGYTATYTSTVGATTKNSEKPEEVTFELTKDNTTGSVAIENTQVPDRFSVSANKNWADDADNAMGTRPTDSKVNFTLQYSLDQGTTWHNVKEGVLTGTAPDTGSDTSNVYYYVVTAGDTHSGYYYINQDGTWNPNADGTDAYTTNSATQVVDGGTLKAAWNNLSVYSNGGNAIYYRVVENSTADGGDFTQVSGYKVVDIKDIKFGETTTATTITPVSGQKGVFTAAKNASADITISNNLDTTKLVLNKTWLNDAANSYTQSMRPDKIVYKIEYKLASETASWQPLPAAITKSVDIDSNGCFEVTVNKVFTDSNKNNDTEVTIEHLPTKNNAGIQYLYRVSEVAIYYGETKVEANLVKKGENITWSLSGTESSFAESGDNSNNTVGAYTITNGTTVWNSDNSQWETNISNKLETTELEATKVWSDDYNRDGLRQNITFEVTPQVKNGDSWQTATGTDSITIPNGTLTWNTSTDNKVKWTLLPKYKKTAAAHNDANVYNYSISEKNADSTNYTTEYTQASAASDSTKLEATATNTHTIEQINISTQKLWKDDDANSMSSRPAEIYVTLQYQKQDGTWANVPVNNNNDGYTPYIIGSDPANTKKLEPGESNDWSGKVSWTVPKNGNTNSNDNATSNNVKYRVIETDADGTAKAMNGYSITDGVKVSGATGESNVTNTLDPTSLEFSKIWANDTTYLSQVRPDKVTYKLEYSLDGTNWSIVPSDLMKPSTTPSTVTLGETDTGLFTVVVNKSETGTDQVTFTGLPKVNSENQVYLYRVTEVSIQYGEKVVPVDSSNTSYTFTMDSNKTDSKFEGATAGSYTVSGTNARDTDGTWKSEITNSLVTTTYSANKEWSDDYNRDNLRQNVTFVLYRDGSETGNIFDSSKQADTGITKDKANNNKTTEVANTVTVTWTGLPMYKVDANSHTDDNKSVYTAKETNPYKDDEYTNSPEVTSATANTITNTHQIEKITINAIKSWDDYENLMSSRPEKVTYTLQYSLSEPDEELSKVDSNKWNNVESNNQNDGVKPYVISGDVTQTVEKENWTTGATWTVPANWYNKETSTSDVIYYRVLEESVTGYTRVGWVSYSKKSDKNDAGTIQGEVNNKLDTTTLDFTKTWKNEGIYQSAVRPVSVTVKVEYMVEGTKPEEWTVLPDNIAAITIIPGASTEEAAGESSEGADTVSEEAESGSEETKDTYVTGGTFTFTPGKGTADQVTLSGLPIQNASGKKYLYRLSEVSIHYDDGTTAGKDVAVDASSATWSLSATDSTWAGATVGAYNTEGKTYWVDGQNGEAGTWKTAITNTLEVVELEVTKQWEDDGERDDIRSEVEFFVQAQVLKKESAEDKTTEDKTSTDSNSTGDNSTGGELTGNTPAQSGTDNGNKLVYEDCSALGIEKITVTYTAGTVGTATWTGLPKYRYDATAHDADNLYKYVITETKIPTGYTPVYDQPVSATDATSIKGTVTNIHDIYTFEIKAQKEWKDQVLLQNGTDGDYPNAYRLSDGYNTDDKKYERPESVELKLQYYTATGWVDITKVPIVGKFPTAEDITGKEVVYLKKSEDSNLILADGYYRYDTSAGKYVSDESGIYTTSEVTQIIKDSSSESTDNLWVGKTWENLPVYCLGDNAAGGSDSTVNNKVRMVAKYRVVEVQTTGGTNANYLFAQQSDTITGLDAEKKIVTDPVDATVTNMPNAIKLHKVDGKNNDLSGVTFKVEDKDGNVVIDEATTDENGMISFVGMVPGTYKFTETKTAKGQQLLPAPFTVTIPFTMTEAERLKYEKAGTTVNVANAVQKNDLSWTFNQVTYTVTNTANFDIPSTGGNGIYYPGFVAMMVFAVNIILYRRKKKLQ